MKKSLLMVHTGDGKGKTTAALGMALRAAGNGLRVCIIQFIKGSWTYGELTSIRKLGERVELHVMGRGFTWKSDDLEKDAALARDAWELAKEKIRSGDYHLVILDELTYLITYGMLEEKAVLDAFMSRPENVHILVTGRGASKALTEAADMVTEMKAVKHHFRAGVSAQKGIEF